MKDALEWMVFFRQVRLDMLAGMTMILHQKKTIMPIPSMFMKEPGINVIACNIALATLKKYQIPVKFHKITKFMKGDEASGIIACRLSTREDNHIMLMPYNPRALSLHARQSGSKKKVKLNRINVMCPLQPGYMECGYYVLKFMKVVVD